MAPEAANFAEQKCLGRGEAATRWERAVVTGRSGDAEARAEAAGRGGGAIRDERGGAVWEKCERREHQNMSHEHEGVVVPDE